MDLAVINNDPKYERIGAEPVPVMKKFNSNDIKNHNFLKLIFNSTGKEHD